jgi:hypothetical protein
MRNYVQALPFFQRSHKIRQKAFGKKHLSMAAPKSFYGFTILTSLAIENTASSRMQVVAAIGISTKAAKRRPAGVPAINATAGLSRSTKIKRRGSTLITTDAPAVEPVPSAIHRAE